jgi:hypothetical protein
MSHEFEDEIKCPYCDHVFHDSWEHNDDDGREIDCGECGKTFTLEVHVEVTYSTRRTDCDDGAHEWNEPEMHTISQRTADRWNQENFMGRNGHKPHDMWQRSCKHCEETEYESVDVGAPCPFDEAKVPA